MNLNDLEQIKQLLTCAHQLKEDVCCTGEEFKYWRTNLLDSLRTLNSANVRTHEGEKVVALREKKVQKIKRM